jgi:hypothetical protein
MSGQNPAGDGAGAGAGHLGQALAALVCADVQSEADQACDKREGDH